MEMMIQSIEKFDRNISWMVFLKLNPNFVTKTKETFVFGSTSAPSRLLELKAFEKDLVKLMQGIKFRYRSNDFLGALKKELRKSSTQKRFSD